MGGNEELLRQNAVAAPCTQALVVLGTSLQGAAAAFVLTTGRRARDDASGEVAGSEPAATTAHHSAPLPAQPAAVASASANISATAHSQEKHQGKQPPNQQQPSQQLEQGEAAPDASARPCSWNAAQLRLWNPLTGQCVPVKDASCELREVSIGWG
jgi:hypothetical protein